METLNPSGGLPGPPIISTSLDSGSPRFDKSTHLVSNVHGPRINDKNGKKLFPSQLFENEVRTPGLF